MTPERLEEIRSLAQRLAGNTAMPESSQALSDLLAHVDVLEALDPDLIWRTSVFKKDSGKAVSIEFGPDAPDGGTNILSSDLDGGDEE